MEQVDLNADDQKYTQFCVRVRKENIFPKFIKFNTFNLISNHLHVHSAGTKKINPLVYNITINDIPCIPMLLFILNIKFNFLSNWRTLSAEHSIKPASQKFCLNLTHDSVSRGSS